MRAQTKYSVNQREFFVENIIGQIVQYFKLLKNSFGKMSIEKQIINDDINMNLLLYVQENLHVPNRQIIRKLEFNQPLMARILKTKKFYPYKMAIL